MPIQVVKNYLTSNVNHPYFFIVGDAQYKNIKDKLLELGLSFIKVSDFCKDDDKLPDIDSLFERLKNANENTNNNRLVVIGIGEYLALRGNNEAVSVLSQLKDLNIGSAKVVLLLRGITAQINFLKTDPRFDSRRFYILDKADSDLSITLVDPSIELSNSKGIKDLLNKFENGVNGNIIVQTKVCLDNTLLTVHKITNAYECIKITIHDFNLPFSCGSNEQWTELLRELTLNNGSLNAIFEKYNLCGFLEEDFYVRIAGLGYRNWLYFIALKIKSETLSNSYLRYVLDKTNNFEDFKTNVLNTIIVIPHNDKRFNKFYDDRKRLVEKFPESDIANFVVSNCKNTSESIYKLTNNTNIEREEIIAWISKNGLTAEIEQKIADIYPELAAYLKKYIFNCGELSDQLTEYFDDYKRQKIFNRIENNFLKKVEELAISRCYNRLPTRNEIIESLNKSDTYLYWLDALGVEYLALISELAKKHGLSISINIARAELPTITDFNQDFYESWQGKKEKNDELDNIKHNDKSGYNFENNELPVHLAKELDIISSVIDKAATELALRHYKRFLIVSDHGASRLAVLCRKEEKYETGTKGEHSGRCCESFYSYNNDLQFATEENGYLVLADYGRFKGSRAASIEVHGGASLEEVVIPIIELTLKDSNITVELEKEVVYCDYKIGSEVILFFNTPLKKEVSIVLNGKRYPASPLDEYHYKVLFPDIKQAGNYPADVYIGDDLIEKKLIKVQSKSGKINEAFDDLL